MENVFETLTGHRFKIRELAESEKEFLERVFAYYSGRPAWEDFKKAWLTMARKDLWDGHIQVGCAVYRICQDLATRLGVDEGRVAPPDYRDRIAAFPKKTNNPRRPR